MIRRFHIGDAGSHLGGQKSQFQQAPRRLMLGDSLATHICLHHAYGSISDICEHGLLGLKAAFTPHGTAWPITVSIITWAEALTKGEWE
jgi:hypothetical protein